MAEYYKSSLKSEEIEAALLTAKDLNGTAGIVKADGRGHTSTATPGEDYGYPLLRGNGVPTVNLSGSVGQHYFNIAAEKAPYEYVCVGLYSGGYRWLPIGESSSGFVIRGYYKTLAELQAAVPSPNVGDAYGVGEVGAYDIYIFDGVSGAWLNNGDLKGEPGAGVIPHGAKGQYLGKASADSYDTAWLDMAMLGEDAPTELTEPEYIGQLYIDITATAPPYMFICTGSVAADSGTEYVWRPVLTDIIGTDMLDSLAVTTPKIANTAVTRAKLADDAKSKVFSATLLASGWGYSNGYYYQDFTVTGVSTTMAVVVVDVDTSAITAANVMYQAEELETAWSENIIKAYVRMENQMRVWFRSPAAIDIPIKIVEVV